MKTAITHYLARNAGPQDFIEMACAIHVAINSQCNDGSAETAASAFPVLTALNPLKPIREFIH